MTFQIEFPDYPAADMPAIPAGFVDHSWHNETCPFFWDKARRLGIWVDYVDASKREFPDNPRFTIIRTEEDGSWDGSDDQTASDDWAVILAAL